MTPELLALANEVALRRERLQGRPDDPLTAILARIADRCGRGELSAENALPGAPQETDWRPKSTTTSAASSGLTRSLPTGDAE